MTPIEMRYAINIIQTDEIVSLSLLESLFFFFASFFILFFCCLLLLSSLPSVFLQQNVKRRYKLSQAEMSEKCEEATDLIRSHYYYKIFLYEE